MEVYVSDKFNIRTIEEKDIKNILTLYNQELTTCNCLNTNLYNGLEEMATILDTITHNNNEKYQLLILEDYYKLIGFTLIRKSVKDLYNIDFITIEKQKRNQGYGTILLDVIKELAIEDKSRLKTYTYMGDFFEHNGFYKKSMCAIDYTYMQDMEKYRPVLKYPIVNKIFGYDEYSSEKVKTLTK